MKEMKTVVDENGNYELKFTDMYLEMTMYDKKGKQAHRRRYIKILSAIILLYLIVFKQLGGFKLHLSFCGSILSVLYILMTYVERRSVLAVKGFGLSISSYYCLNIRKSTTFVPSQNIHKIVVNEIKHMNQIDYYLQVLITGELFKESPTIVIKNNLPCLRLLYQNLTSVLLD